MRSFILLPYYLKWHYGDALNNIMTITGNLVWFFWHFFSISILAKTLFTPWQKMHEDRPYGIEIGPILGTLIINSLMRIAGALIRLFMIVIGLVLIAATTVASAAFFLIWLSLPIVIPFSFVLGIVLLFK